MPSMANMTIKKYDGTTDIVYTGVVPSSGDGVAAVWKAQTVGTAPNHQPELRLSSREAGNGQKRALRATYVYPTIATNSTTGVTSVIDKCTITIDWSMSKAVTQTDLNEAAAQLANLLDNTLITDSVRTGYAPT